ncbi:TPA: hypothetical protein ACJKLK_003173 [Acinetobacter baumannii]
MNIINKIIDMLLSSTPKNKTKETDKSLTEFFGILAALTIIFLIWVYYPTFIIWMDRPNINIQIPLKLSEMGNSPINPNNFHEVGERFGTYGDSYGSLNTLFSGFAFAILIISLFMQRQELKEQRKELEAQRHEIKESNNIAEAQRKITEQQAVLIEQQITDSKIQSFYQLLFKYIDEKNRKISDLRASDVTGQRLINYFCDIFEREFSFSNNPEYISKIDYDSLNNYINECLVSAHINTANQLIVHEYAEYLNFILRFIESHNKLDITENAILTFISYQNINEMKCMAYLAINNEELFEFIYNYSLLRKLNTYEEESNFFHSIVYRIYQEDAYTP